MGTRSDPNGATAKTKSGSERHRFPHVELLVHPFERYRKHMYQPQIMSIAVRELEIPVASLRYVATPRIWLRNVNGSGREISLAQYFGMTPEDAQAKAEEALTAWKFRK